MSTPMTPDTLQPGTTYYALVGGVVYPRRYETVTTTHDKGQPLYLFLDERNRAHSEYTSGLLSYFAREDQALTMLLEQYEGAVAVLRERLQELDVLVPNE